MNLRQHQADLKKKKWKIVMFFDTKKSQTMKPKTKKGSQKVIHSTDLLDSVLNAAKKS